MGASPEALLAALKGLGAPLGTIQDSPSALRERTIASWNQIIEPVIVAWEGEAVEIELQLPAHRAQGSIECSLRLESGDVSRWAVELGEMSSAGTVSIEGNLYLRRRLPMPAALPWGYHHLSLEAPAWSAGSMVISAPLKAYTPPQWEHGGLWGMFLPLYALHSQRSWGAGDFTDFEALIGWAGRLGATAVATLPLMASFLDEPFAPSPYAPASRLLWNELFIDVPRVPEMSRCPEARALMASPQFREEVQALRTSSLVDYRKQMSLKRKVLEILSNSLSDATSDRYREFRLFVQSHPRLQDYARFRATGERFGSPWPAWPSPLRDGVIKQGDYSEAAARYHEYVQWVAHQQLGSVKAKASDSGPGLLLDLPIGVHPDSYDVWRERSTFVTDISAGAPPDPFFRKGQNWGFPPLHPERIRQQGYGYFVECLRHVLSQSRFLRLDHVMGLHRLFWVPRGMEPKEGIYVRYPAEELYAILALESHRHQTVIIGEDLGTVPPYVRPAMARHKVQRTAVLQFNLSADPSRAIAAICRDSLASLNTHDTPTFSGYWHGLDFQDRRDLALLNEREAQQEYIWREAMKEALASFLRRRGLLKDAASDEYAILRACLAFLSSGPGRILLINLEDLWLEKHPQNVPGTVDERPNWRRKAQHPFEVFSQMPGVLDALREVDSLRS